MLHKYLLFFSKFREICLFGAIGLFGFSPLNAEGVVIKSFGHSSFLITGGGHSVLLNPFKAVGCAEGLSVPNVMVDVVLASSELPDEGSWNKHGVFFVEPGSYLIGGLKLEGFAAFHDRDGGRRFGHGTYWQWNQAGLNFAHLAGIAGSLNVQDKLHLGRPDILFLGVGGGKKVYNSKEAAVVIDQLNPRIVIPGQYLSNRFYETKYKNCDQTGIQPFLDATKHIKNRKVGKKYIVPKILPEKTVINLMN